MGRYYEDELIHYGVKGMKWGVRRYQPYSYTGGGSGKEVGLAKKLSKAGGSSESRAQRKARKKANKAIIKQRKEDVKNRRTMTDEELNERINRIRRENELQNLTRQNIETPVSRELKNIGNKYKNRVEEDIVNATYNVAKIAAKKGIADKVVPKVVSKNPFRKRYVEMARMSKDGGSSKSKHDTYKSRSILAAIAKRKNKQVDKNFDKWKENSQKREEAIEIGKKMNAARISGDKETYKSLKKQYQKALRENTTYRKGQVEQAVLSDVSRKYLSMAKRTKKALDKDPANKSLKKQYANEMDQYEKTRAKARKAPEKYANRSQLKANVKRKATIATKTAATVGAVYVGAKAYNHVAKKKNLPRFSKRDAQNIANVYRKAKKVVRYL